MIERIALALNRLPPAGRALKRHLLDRLLSCAPESLTTAQAAYGGPNRSFASAWYALKALQRAGVVTQDETDNRIARFRLTLGTEDVVRAFVTAERHAEPPSVSPLPGLPRYQRVLKVLYDKPQQSFTVAQLCHEVRRKDATVRRSVQELCEAGYVTRDLLNSTTPGRPLCCYQLNLQAAEHASILLLGTIRDT